MSQFKGIGEELDGEMEALSIYQVEGWGRCEANQ